MGTQVPVGTGMFNILHKFNNTDGLAAKKELLEEVDDKKTKTKGKGKKGKVKEALIPKRKALLSPSDGKPFTPLTPEDLLK